MNIKIISSHYKEDIAWMSKLKYPVEIFSKTIQDSNYINFNKAQEAPAYLKFIINNYNDLPDYCIFIHGHENSYHQNDSMINIINNLNFDKDIINLNRPDWYNKLDKDFGENWKWLEDNWIDLFGDSLPFPDRLWHPACAQFAVKKDCITIRSLEFYKKLYNWCEKNNLSNHISSRIFEYTWYYIFTNKQVFTD